MSTTLRAQLWEFGRASWLGLLSNLVYLLALTVLDYFIFFDLFSGDPQTNARGIPLMSLMGYIIFVTAISNELVGVCLGFSIRLGFTRPISTTQLVVAPMLFNVIAALGLFLIPAALFGFLLGTDVPLVGPSALFACMVTCCIASMWSFSTVAGRWIGFVLTWAVFALLLLMIDRLREETLPYWARTGALEYWEFPLYVYLGLALLTAAAIAFTVFAVDRQRHGDSIGLAIPLATAASRNVLRFRVAKRTSDVKPFRNQWTAQCWYEFQQIRKVLLFPVFLAPIFILALVGVGNSLDPGWEESFYTWLGSLVLCPMLYQLVATAATNGGAFSSPVFDATRPMRCDHLIAMKLLLIAGWSLVGCLMMAVAALLQLRFIGYWENLTNLVESLSAPVGEISVYWWMAGAVSALLLYIGTTSMLLAFPSPGWTLLRPYQYISAGVLAIIHLLMVVIDIIDILSFRYLWIAYGYLFPVFIVVLCVIDLKQALGSGFLSKTYLVTALSVWAVFVCTTIALAIKLSPAIPPWIPLSAYLIGIAMLMVPLAKTAVAPLTLASHRHA